MTDYNVIFETRRRGALGVFTWHQLQVSAVDARMAVGVAQAQLHQAGFETRGGRCCCAHAWPGEGPCPRCEIEAAQLRRLGSVKAGKEGVAIVIPKGAR